MLLQHPSTRSAVCTMLFFLAATSIACVSDSTAQAEENAKGKVLIVAGPSGHPPGTHEVNAGARLMAYCLQHPQNVDPLPVELRFDWPNDAKELVGVRTIVFIGDLFPPEQMPEPDKVKRQISRMMNAGCSMVCVHYATGLRKQHVSPEGEHPLLGWLGGYFASGCPHHQSVARLVTATVEPEATDHPVLRGWKKFTFDDEPYWNNYFGQNGPGPNVTSLAYAMLPPEAPKKETIVWAVQRKDGGRGVGIVMPHYFHNWKIDDLRTLILNSIYWADQKEIPADGVQAKLPDLATFQPESVEPAR